MSKPSSPSASSSGSAGRLLFPRPLLLIAEVEVQGNDKQMTERKLQVEESTLKVLAASIGSRPVRVAGVLGPYRTGKSYVLNRLLNHEGAGGFDLGHSVKSKTKGIYVWAMEIENGEALIALDTEGLGDPEKTSCTEDDVKRFLITLLLTSHLTINILNVIDAQVLDRLKFVADLTSKLTTKRKDGEEEDGTNFNQYFPQLMFLIRDFTKDLTLPEDGFSGDPDKYLLSLLARVPGKSDSIRRHNEVREIIRDSFPKLTCRVLVPPTLRPEVELLLLDSKDGEKCIREEFKQGCAKVLNEIRAAPLKRIEQAQVTGESFCLLVSTYVNDINDPNKVPSIPNAFDAICDIQAKGAITKSEQVYVNAMDKVQLPQEADALLELHRAALGAAHRTLDDSVAGRALNSSKVELERLIQEQNAGEICGGHWFRYLSLNRDASRLQCQSKWDELMAVLNQQVANGAFKSPSEFQAACSALEQQYMQNSIGPAKAQVKSEQQSHISDLLQQVSVQLKLDDATKQALELKQEMHAKQAKLEEMDGELKRVREDGQAHEEEAKKRQAELLQKMQDEKTAHDEEMKKLEAEQARKIEKASGEMRKEMQAQLAETKRQAEEDNKKRDAEWQAQIDEEKKRAAEQLEEMKKNDAKVSSKKYMVPVTNMKTGQTAMVEMTLDEIRKLGLNEYK